MIIEILDTYMFHDANRINTLFVLLCSEPVSGYSTAHGAITCDLLESLSYARIKECNVKIKANLIEHQS